MAIARSIEQELSQSSWIRRMFEIGQALKERLGEEAVCDFTLGSPILEPPPEFTEALRDLVNHPIPGMHRYMSNAGYLTTRRAIAAQLRTQEQVEMSGEDIIVTVGSAGAINVALTSILDPGDEVIVLAPYFVEYLFYVRHHGGITRIVRTTETFGLDIAALEQAFGERTKAVIVNTPNNPTGRVYSQEEFDALAAALARAEQRYGTNIHLILDTPYAKITYAGARNPRAFLRYPSAMIAHSYSKELGIAGQRIGFLAINPASPDHDLLCSAATMVNRTLGFINGPALMQLALERSLNASVDVKAYQQLRDALCDGLSAAGYVLTPPQGTFYAFPQTPIADDVAFVQELLQENVLVVPGSGFGCPGYMRIAFCVNPDTIQRALPRFARVIRRVQAG